MQQNIFYKIFCRLGIVISAYLMSDFLMGMFHWLKDTYFSPHTFYIGKRFIWNSRLHHIKPRYITQFSNWKIFMDSAKWTLLWMAPLTYFIGINLFTCILFFMIGINDIIHKYAHTLDHERPKLITLLQKTNIIQSREEHYQHHISPHEINYCPITPYLNGVLQKVNFWRRLESVVEKISGVKPRENQPDYVEDDNYPAGIRFI